MGPVAGKSHGAVTISLVLRRVLAGLTLVLAVAACGSESRKASAPKPVETTLPPPPETIPPNLSQIAEATVPVVGIYDSPDQPQPARTLPNPGTYGEPMVFLVKEMPKERLDWLIVYLPVRPNGSAAWVRASEMKVTTTQYRIVVELGAHRLTVWNGDQVFLQEPVGVGTPSTPTPKGLFYLRFLYQSKDATDRSKYGPFAYPISGFSEVFDTFMGGNGESGIHGTNNPADLGKDVSNGCVRMSNEGITKLAQALPAGTPVEILP